MNKSRKIILSIVILTSIVIAVILQIQSKQQSKLFIYPTPGTKEWIELGSLQARYDACQLPEDILSDSSTKDLLEIILDYPFITEMFAFGSIDDGYMTVKNRFNGLREFECREDAAKILIERYKSTSFIPSTSENYDRENSRDFSVLSIMAEQDVYRYSFNNYEEARQYEDVLLQKQSERTGRTID